MEKEREGGSQRIWDGGGVPSLPVARYRFLFRALDRIDLPPYAGSAWRGVFGHGLKKSLCVTGLPQCDGCQLARGCAYVYLFETPPPPDTAKLRRYTSAPHPFVIETSIDAPRVIERGAVFDLGWALVGRANARLAYIIQGLRAAGQRGIGRGRGRFAVEAVEQESTPGAGDWRTVYEAASGVLRLFEPALLSPPEEVPDAIRLAFRTPLRLKREGRLVGPEDFEFHDLFRNLLRRLSLLSYFHSDDPWELDFAGLSRGSRGVVLAGRRLEWYEWARYSGRQGTPMKMGGLVGEVWLEGEAAAAYWPFLWLGQWVHAGKGTSMGLGRFRVETASLPNGGVGHASVQNASGSAGKE